MRQGNRRVWGGGARTCKGRFQQNSPPSRCWDSTPCYSQAKPSTVRAGWETGGGQWWCGCLLVFACVCVLNIKLIVPTTHLHPALRVSVLMSSRETSPALCDHKPEPTIPRYTFSIANAAEGGLAMKCQPQFAAKECGAFERDRCDDQTSTFKTNSQAFVFV